jgi:hypothetical protein
VSIGLSIKPEPVSAFLALALRNGCLDIQVEFHRRLTRREFARFQETGTLVRPLHKILRYHTARRYRMITVRATGRGGVCKAEKAMPSEILFEEAYAPPG